ncbi:sulfonate ABC transporter substrate-binding protein [Paenibacillus oenotherae]|uniref:Sulfonate ABC transporter substrate-binding protein n=1 Tax=Paenibacillus oenotherae TaxID=1435645 RepID=A0ABS7D8E9_9BACL|nr:sulfonate ABC transporter substrate-binding protein [Paenibacillus oenotherae]MBW7475448.1 sulfonate ABC transporter substrate-binding protein [Paenibacillus oenotherae]
MKRRSAGKSAAVLSILLLSMALVLSACSAKNNKNSADGSASQQGDSSGSASTGDSNTADKKPEATKELRFGYQKYGTVNILKAQGHLDKRLEAEGYKVTWTEFPGGPQLLEALNVGSIDVGHTGEAPPIFAQAAGAPLIYLGHEPASPGSEGILVPKDSKIATVADLKGKKVALNKGSNVHYLLVKALEQAGVAYEDIETVFLKPGDARVAFDNGSVDAWVIWDPFLAAAQTATGAKLLIDGKDLVANHEFYLASRSFVEGNKAIIDSVLDELNKVDVWAKENQKEVAALLSPQLNIDVPALELASGRRDYGLLPIDESIIEAQQQIADTFFKLGLIPNEIKVKDAVIE